MGGCSVSSLVESGLGVSIREGNQFIEFRNALIKEVSKTLGCPLSVLLATPIRFAVEIDFESMSEEVEC